MAVVSKIMHYYQLSCESWASGDKHQNVVCYSATGHSYLLTTKLAYKTRGVDDKCHNHALILCMHTIEVF